MATITKLQDLLPLLGSVATAADPVATLEKGGTAFSPALRESLRPRLTPTPAQQQLWNKTALKAGTLTYTTGEARKLPKRPLAAGEYEFSAGITTDAANAILAGLLASGTIPPATFLDELLSSGDIDALGGLFHVDRPGGRIGRLLITSGPTIAPIRDGFNRVAFIIPFQLDFEHVTNVVTGQIRSVVTYATGHLTLSVGLVTKLVPVSVAARNIEIQIDLSSSDDASLVIDSASPVQLTSPDHANGVAIIIQNALQQRLASSLQFTISASIPVPIGKLEIHETAVLTRGNALLVGVKVQGTPSPGDPTTLTALFPDTQSNFFSRLHDEVLSLILQSALQSGELTQIAKQTHPDAVIESADIAFGQNTFQVATSGKIVNLCPLHVDLGFTITTTITLTLEGTQIEVTKGTNTDLDDVDVVLCIVTSLGLALLAAIGIVVSQGLSLASGFEALGAFGVIGVISILLEFDGDDFKLVFGSGGDGQPEFIQLDFPFPGTDLLPTLSGSFMRLDESTMLMAAQLGTRPDNINTYFYVRFEEPNSLGIPQPMKNVKVALMDRDSPAPAGDDVVFPAPSSTSSGHRVGNETIAFTTATHYERTADETFSHVTTDRTGLVRIYLSHNQLASKGGNKVVETTHFDPDLNKQTTSTVRTPYPEASPDFYFRVTRADNSVVDTLQIPSGFFLNFKSARVGTPANPLTISFGGISVVGRTQETL